MRILHVVHEDPLSFAGGVQVYVRQIAETQAAAGHHVMLFAMGKFDGKLPYRKLNEGGVHYYLIDYNALTSGKKRFRFYDSYKNSQVTSLFYRLLNEMEPDVAHVHHLLLLSGEIVHTLRSRNIAMVATLHDYWYLCHRIKLLFPDLADCTGPNGGRKCRDCGDPFYTTFPGRLFFPLIYLSFIQRYNYLRAVLGAFDRILSPSMYLRQVYIENGVPAHRILHSPLGIRDVLFRYQFVDRESRTFGFIGALQPAKGLDYLVRAFNELEGEPATLKIYGSGEPDYVESLMKLAHNPAIEFMGGFANEDLPQAFEGLDALILPSIWKENSPVSIHEALAARIPVLASRLGGIPELVIDDVNGLLFEHRNSQAIRRAVQRILADPKQLETFTKNSGMVRSFDENAVELEEIYREIRKTRSL